MKRKSEKQNTASCNLKPKKNEKGRSKKWKNLVNERNLYQQTTNLANSVVHQTESEHTNAPHWIKTAKTEEKKTLRESM